MTDTSNVVPLRPANPFDEPEASPPASLAAQHELALRLLVDKYETLEWKLRRHAEALCCDVDRYTPMESLGLPEPEPNTSDDAILIRSLSHIRALHLLAERIHQYQRDIGDCLWPDA